MTLELYYFNTCPYCQKVRNVLQQQERTDVVYRDVLTDPEAYDTLLQVGGKDQVPCLFIDGTPLYESDDIIAWLEKHPQEK